VRPRMIKVLAAAAVVLGCLLLIPAAYARLGSASPAPRITDGGDVNTDAGQAAGSPPAPPTLAAADVRLDVDGFASWALLDRTTGRISGSKNITATSSTESMIKAWIVSDYLQQFTSKKPSATMLRNASLALRDSDDDATESLYKAAGGYSGGSTSPVVNRMIKACKLTETRAVVPPGSKVVWWAYTQISARDAVRLGECIKNGTAAGPKWTSWVLDEMTKVRGTTAKKDQEERRGGGRWGIIDGLPKELLASSGPVSIKNGWTQLGSDGQWHVSCLAITDKWVLSVLTRYSGKLGLDYGANVCASVASQLVTPKPDTGTNPPPANKPTPSPRSEAG
jgi:hypothetical protein